MAITVNRFLSANWRIEMTKPMLSEGRRGIGRGAPDSPPPTTITLAVSPRRSAATERSV